MQHKNLFGRPIFPSGVLAVCLCTAFTVTAQGPLDGYMKGKGHLDVALSFSSNSAKIFDGGAGQSYVEGYKGNLLSAFAEYGVSDNFDVVATVPYIFTADQNGLQDGGLYVKYRPLKSKIARLGQLSIVGGMGASFPLSDYEPTATGALGTKAVVVPARLIAQLETNIGFFINVTGGYNWRLDDLKEKDIAAIKQQQPDYQPIAPPNYTTFLAKIGLPAKHYYLDCWWEWQNTTGGKDYQPNVPDLPQAYGVSYHQIGGTAYYSENGKTGYYVSSGYILGGRNVSRIFRLTGGIVFKL